MARSRPIRTSFAAGEWSPRLIGRVDLPKYIEAAETIENFLVQPQGGLIRRSGSRYVAASKAQDYDPKLIPFEFGPDQSYVIECGARYMRFFTLGRQITVGATDSTFVNGDFSNALTGWTDTSFNGGSTALATAVNAVPGSVGTPIGNMTSGAGLAAAFTTVDATVGYRYHRIRFDGGTANLGFGVSQVRFYEDERALVSRLLGTPIGNMSSGGGVASAFDGNNVKVFNLCARVGVSTASIGKDWGSGVTRKITGFEVFSSSDQGFKNSENPQITVKLQGSTNNSTWVDLMTLTVLDQARYITAREFSADPSLDKEFLECAVSSQNVAYIGKDWGSGVTKTIASYVLRGSSNAGFKNGENPRFTATLQGSSDNFASVIVDLGEINIVDRSGAITVQMRDGIDTSTAYRYHRLELRGGSREAGFAVGHLQFNELSADTGRLRLIPSTGTARTRQTVSFGAAFRQVPHTVTFRVVAQRGASARFSVGSAANLFDIVPLSKVSNGSHSFTFVPNRGTASIEFRSNGTVEAQIEAVRYTSDTVDRPYEISSPYSRGELQALRYTQAGDVMWITIASQPPQKLIRRGDTDFRLEDVPFVDGPYLDENTDETITITASNLTGGTTLTASEALFKPGHRGALFRLCAVGGVPGHKTWKAAEAVTAGDYRKFEDNVYVATTTATTGNSPPVHEQGTVSDGGVSFRFVNRNGWGYVVIVTYTSSTVVGARVMKELDPSVTSGTSVWREGAFSGVQGYPQCVGLVSNRLIYGKGISLYMSRVGNYDDFTPDLEDDDAVYLTLAGAVGAPIQWITGQQRVVAGTAKGPFIIRGSSDDEPLTPDNAQARQLTAAGTSPEDAFVADEAVLYLSRSNRRLYELATSFETSDFRAVELTILSDHVLANGSRRIQFAREPQPTVWVQRDDGQLATMSYNRAENVVAWTRQIMGGRRAGGNIAKVVSLSIIPGQPDDERRDEVWLCVQRTVNGADVRFIEYLENDLNFTDDPEDAYYVDAGLRYSGTTTKSINPFSDAGTAGARNVLFQTGSDFFASTDVGRLIATGTKKLSGTAEITRYLDPTSVRCTIRRPFTNTGIIKAGSWSFSARTLSGLDHLEGEEVSILADGATHPKKTVRNGSITLDRQAFEIAVGLPIEYRFKSLKIAEGGQVGSGVAAKRKITKFAVGLIGTLAARVGTRSDLLTPVIIRKVSDVPGRPPDLFTGEVIVQVPPDWQRDPRIVIEGDDPAPLSLTHVVLDDMDTNELS